MPINTTAGEDALKRCNGCGTKVDEKALFTQENGNQFCLSCWLEKGNHSKPHRRLTLVES